MKQRVIWMFPGQGAQYFQMGRELFGREAVFRKFLEEADAVVRRLTGVSLIEEVYRERPNRFEPMVRLLLSHPALLAVECGVAAVLRARGVEPGMVLGCSLGECSALVAAGALDFDEALVASVRQAALVEYLAPAGRMIAVLGAATAPGAGTPTFDGCTVAGWNFPGSFVLSGGTGPVTRACEALRRQSVSFLELPVVHPFHSPMMDGLREPSLGILGGLRFGAPRCPVLSARTGRALESVSPAHLWEATRQPVDVAGTLRTVEAAGPAVYVDLGPSGNMATAVKYNLARESASEIFPILTPFGQDLRNLDRVLARLGAGG